jgi:hypothetical protein
MTTLPVRTGNGDIVSNNQDSQAALVPILTECCEETCQTITATGTVNIAEEQYTYGYYYSTFNFWYSPAIAFIMPNGGYFSVNISYFAGGYNQQPGYTSYSEVFINYYYIDSNGGEYQGSESFDGAVLADDDTWEIRLSWCEDCTVLCETDINGSPFSKVDITNVCGIAGPLECNFDLSCRPTTEFSGATLLTGVPMTITVTDIGGGIYEINLDDDAPTGTVADPASAPGFSSGALFACSNDCLPNGYSPMWFLDALEGVTPYTIPIIDNLFFQGPSGAGTEITYRLDPAQWAGDCSADFLQAIADAGAFFAAWVVTYGSGTPVMIENASIDALQCTDRWNQLLPVATLIPAAAGFIVPQSSDYNPEPGFSNIESFDMDCGSLTPGGALIELQGVGQG